MYKALVTGGTKGIGAAIAERLKVCGYEVITCARDQRATIRCDVTDAAAVETMRENIGVIDVLVNNVGGVITTPFLKLQEKDWDWHFLLNVKSAFYCTKAFLPEMLKKRWGRIINIASTAAKMGAPYLSAYVASKHALVGFTKALAQEVAEQGVTVNAVCPSFVDTPMLRESAERISQKTGKSPEELIQTYQSRNPQKRLITGEEVSRAVQFLIETPGINGQAISICGGETY